MMCYKSYLASIFSIRIYECKQLRLERYISATSRVYHVERGHGRALLSPPCIRGWYNSSILDYPTAKKIRYARTT